MELDTSGCSQNAGEQNPSHDDDGNAGLLALADLSNTCHPSVLSVEFGSRYMLAGLQLQHICQPERTAFAGNTTQSRTEYLSNIIAEAGQDHMQEMR